MDPSATWTSIQGWTGNFGDDGDARDFIRVLLITPLRLVLLVGIFLVMNHRSASNSIRPGKHFHREVAVRVIRDAWGKGNLAAPCLGDEVLRMASRAVDAWRTGRFRGASSPSIAEWIAAALSEGMTKRERERLRRPMLELARAFAEALRNEDAKG